MPLFFSFQTFSNFKLLIKDNNVQEQTYYTNWCKQIIYDVTLNYWYSWIAVLSNCTQDEVYSEKEEFFLECLTLKIKENN